MKQINKNNNIELFETSIYKDVISKRMFARGQLYFLEDKIKFVSKKNNIYNFVAKGTKDYKVSVEFNADNKILFAECTCPFYKKENRYCKHIAGSIYSIKCSNNHEIITHEINVALKEADKIKNKFEKLIKEKKYIISYSNDDVYNKFNNAYSNAINKKDKQLLDNDLLSILYDLKNKTAILNFSYNELLKNKKAKANSSINSNTFLSILKTIFKGILKVIDLVISLFMLFINSGVKEKKVNSNLYNSLEPWQQDLVNQGKYDETSFDEEELEDDDYYNEDI